MPVLTDGWQEAVADRATTYVTETTWRQLFSSRRKRRCKILAEGARKILAGKKKLHAWMGSVGAWLVSFFTGDRVIQAFTRELAQKIPLPHEAKVVAVARGIQVAGILLCVFNGDDLTRCQCFIDLALEETKTVVKKILIAATHDWIELAAFPAKTSGEQTRTQG